jgi:hypothetical protein
METTQNKGNVIPNRGDNSATVGVLFPKSAPQTLCQRRAREGAISCLWRQVRQRRRKERKEIETFKMALSALVANEEIDTFKMALSASHAKCANEYLLQEITRNAGGRHLARESSRRFRRSTTQRART